MVNRRSAPAPRRSRYRLGADRPIPGDRGPARHRRTAPHAGAGCPGRRAGSRASGSRAKAACKAAATVAAPTSSAGMATCRWMAGAKTIRGMPRLAEMVLLEQCRSPAGHGWRGPPSGRHTPQRRSSAIPAARRGPPILPRPAKNRRRLSIRRPAVRPVREAGQNGPSLRRTTRRTQMRFMVIVKATQASEAGEMPSEELLAAMGRYNEELVKAGVMLAGEGLQPSAKGAGAFLRQRADGDRRPLRRDPRADRRFLDVPGGLPGRGHRVGQAMPEPIRRRIRDRDPPGLRGRGLRRGVHRNCASASACAPSWKNATEPPRTPPRTRKAPCKSSPT